MDGLVSKNLLGLYNGVSQQSATIRLDSQCELQENYLGTVVDGLCLRPNTEFLKKILSNAGERSFIHRINRGDGIEEYLVIITQDADNPIEIYDKQWNSLTVRYGHLDEDLVFTADDDVKDYLVSDDPLTEFSLATSADYTIVANKKIITEIVDEATDADLPYAVFVVDKGVAQTTYALALNGGSEVSHTTEASGGNYDTGHIATELYNGLCSTYGTTLWNFVLFNNLIKIKKVDDSDFTITARDSWGNHATKLIKGQIQNFSDLPNIFWENLRCKVIGSDGNSFENFYVVYSNTGGSKTGVWQETVKGGLKNGFKPLSLPHRLVRTAEGEFTFADIEWAERTVGDEDSAPAPSFIGDVINKVGFHANRLFFLAGENLIMSKTGEYFDLFPTTVMDVLDDDPIDTAVPFSKISTLCQAEVFNENLLLLAPETQFVVSAGEAVWSPKTITIEPVPSYPCFKDTAPVTIGANVYFAGSNGSNSIFREFYIQGETMVNDALDISAHVPNYVPDKIIKLGGNSQIEMVLCLSELEPKSLYVYKFLWSGTEKMQSAWSKWTFDDEIINFSVDGCSVYLLCKRGEEIFIQKMQIDRSKTGNLPFRVHLDKLVALAGVYDEETDTTTWTLPYIDDNTDFVVVDPIKGNPLYDLNKVSNTQISILGDYSAGNYYIGKLYEARFRFSEWFLKEKNSNLALIGAKLQIRGLALAFKNTGNFELQYTPKNRELRRLVFSGVFLGYSVIGEPTLWTKTHKFSIKCASQGSIIDLVVKSYLPAEFLGAEFTGYCVVHPTML